MAENAIGSSAEVILIGFRTQGQLKNKFYSFLRSFILKALQLSKQLKSFKVNSISSKTIKRLFEGTQGTNRLRLEF
jgi:hypothetical protein